MSDGFHTGESQYAQDHLHRTIGYMFKDVHWALLVIVKI